MNKVESISESSVPDDKVANDIIKKVNRLIEVNEKIAELSKPLKPFKEEKKLIMDDLTDLFIDHNIETYEVNGQIVSLCDKIVKKKIDESTISKGIENKFSDINKLDNIDKLTEVLINSIVECQETSNVQTIKITKKKKVKETKKSVKK